MPTATVEKALEEYQRGKIVIIVDDEDRENEGDLAIAAEKVTPEAVNFMAKFGRGLICVAMPGPRLDELQIPLMVPDNTSKFSTAFCISVEARGRVTTGISAHDRSETITALIDPKSGPGDFLRPGHTFPLRCRDGGVLVRAGQTEASADLAKLAGLYPASVICEIMNDDGTMSRMPDLEKFAAKHDLTIISVAQLIEYRHRGEKLVNRISHARLPTDFGEFSIIGYQDLINGDQHVAVVKGEIGGDEPTLVRVQSECLTGDVFASRRCDCGSQLRQALKIIGRTGKGAIVYLRGHEGRGIGLHNKIRAYELQDLGRDTVEANAELGFPADMRHYGIGAQIVVDLGIRRMKLLSNNPRKFAGLQGYGLEVERIPLHTPTNSTNRDYLRAKKEKLGHLLELVEQVAAEEEEARRSQPS